MQLVVLSLCDGHQQVVDRNWRV